MKILISGITGFVGKNLVKYLSNDPSLDLFGLVRHSSDLNSVKGESIKGFFYFENLEQIRRLDPDIIIHLAGKAHDTRNTSQSKEYEQVNFLLTKKIYDLFMKLNSRKFVFLSTVKAAADTVEGTLDETVDPIATTPYGMSKLKAEQYIIKQARPGKTYYILRPCMIHGPGNQGNLNLLYQLIRKGIPYPLGKFHNQRSFLSVDNLNFFIRQLIEKPVDSGVYHLADDQPLSTKEVVKIMGSAINKNIKIWNVPKPVIRFLARIGDSIPFPINTERLIKLTENYVVSNNKIKSAIRKDLPVKSMEGLSKTFKSFNH